jgi:hypothetical protein
MPTSPRCAAGRMSPQEFISAWGRDWKKVIADTKTFFEVADKAKLALDIDGRRPLNGGSPPAPAEAPRNPPQDGNKPMTEIIRLPQIHA